jgi:hypothetical protein
MALPTAETKQATGSSDGKERSNLRNRISNRLQRLNELLVRSGSTDLGVSALISMVVMFVTTGTLRRDLAARPLPLHLGAEHQA